MGWFDWVADLARQVGVVIDTGLRGIIDLAEEIRPYVFPRPASPEQIEEIIEEMAYTEQFIREAIPDEAIRLARGVRFYEPLTNVARLRHWTTQAVQDIIPGLDTQISIRRVLVGPDGTITHVDIAFGYGELYDEDLALRKTAAALEDEFVDRYDLSRSMLVSRYVVAEEVFLQRHVPL